MAETPLLQEPSPTAPPANLAGTNEALDRIALSHVQTVHNRLRSLRTPLEADWVDRSRAYDLLKVKQYYQGRSDLTLPTPANLVERLVPRVVRATVGRTDFFDALPERSEDEDKADVNAALVKSQLHRANFRRKYPKLIRDTAIYGTGLWKARWRNEVRSDTRQTLFDGPDGAVLSIESVWVDPRAEDFDKTDVVEEMTLSFTEVANLVRRGLFAPGPAGEALQSGVGSKDSGATLTMRSRKKGFEPPITPGHYRYTEFWGEFPITATDALTADRVVTVPCVIGVLGGKYIVRLERNPYECQKKPYFKSVFLERSGEFYGISLLGKIIDLWIEQNDCRNQANDARSFAVCPVFVKTPSGSPDKQTSQRIFPGAVITAPQGSSFASFPDTTAAAMNAEPILRRDMEETMGAPSLLDAQSSADSATEAGIQQVESGVRITEYAHVVEDVFLVPLLSFIHDMNKQYLSDEGAVRIKGFKGFDFRPVTKADIAGNFTFQTVGASSMARGAALTAQFLQATDRMLLVEQIQPGTFDMTKWWSTFFKEALDIPHPETYIKGLQFQGRIPTVDEVHLMLANGQKVVPDPRQDFAVTLPEYGAYINKVRGVLADQPEILKNFIAHLLDAEATAKQVLAAAQAERQQALIAQSELAMKQKEMQDDAEDRDEDRQMKRESHEAKMQAAGSSGGKQNKSTSGMHRDGQGMSNSRQAMMNANGGKATS